MGLTANQQKHLEEGKGREMAKISMEKVEQKFAKASITDTPEMNFPSNSEKNKGKKIRQIAQGTVIPKKKSLGKKMSELFIAEDFYNVAIYILREVLLPSAKSTFLDLIITGADRLVNGDNMTSNKRKRYGNGSIISYGSYYKDRPDDTRYFNEHHFAPKQPVSTMSRRIRQTFDDILFDDRRQAEEVITYMVEILDQYGIVSIAEFYDMVNIEVTSIDYKYGWDNLANVSTQRIRDGWIINLPRPKSL